MITDAMFSIPRSDGGDFVSITFDGTVLQVPAGITVAAALLVGGVRDFRASIVGAVPRAPYCMMGVCFECLVEIDGVPARQSCLIPVSDGMVVRRQIGAAHLDDLSFGDEP
ncbi:MAG: (2Fe-2S)-binding protein [Hyphomicrobiales bacterium]|nr:MAG: (2Fe-2S)-binding protein [Hyphomicrobiales bacterium]